MIPNGVFKKDAEAVNLSKAYMACSNFRGIDNLQLKALMLKTASGLYSGRAGTSFPIPSDLIGDNTLAITQAVS